MKSLKHLIVTHLLSKVSLLRYIKSIWHGFTWHERFLYKLKSVGISGELYNLLENYLSVRFQSVVLNGQTSLWRPILAGVPQRSILSTLLFLIYINDLPNELKSNVTLFANGTSLFTVAKDKNESANVLRSGLQSISIWAYKGQRPYSNYHA